MGEELKVNYVDHISIAVRDLDKAVEDYKHAFGWEVAGRYSDLNEKIRVCYFMVGPTAIELVEDIDGTGETARFIKRFGEGVMIVSYNVDSCGHALELLKRNAVRVIDEKPRLAKEQDRRFAFVHPEACHGVVTEVIDGKY